MARVLQAGLGVLTGFGEAGTRLGCLLAHGVETAETLGSRTSQVACSLCSVPAVLVALGGLPELLEPPVEMVMEVVASSPTRLCGHAACVWGPTGWEGSLVTLRWPLAA